jgi:pimeloyl-ACP methyl ester carboxylesterase
MPAHGGGRPADVLRQRPDDLAQGGADRVVGVRGGVAAVEHGHDRPSASVAAIPVPEGVARAVIRLADERRYDVPVVLICPEFTPAQARQWIDQGEVPELAKREHLSFLDIDSGHWPMISAPADLARLLSQAAEEA